MVQVFDVHNTSLWITHTDQTLYIKPFPLTSGGIESILSTKVRSPFADVQLGQVLVLLEATQQMGLPQQAFSRCPYQCQNMRSLPLQHKHFRKSLRQFPFACLRFLAQLRRIFCARKICLERNPWEKHSAHLSKPLCLWLSCE